MSNLDKCHRVKAKDCHGSILDTVIDPETWVYWCGKLQSGWRKDDCSCEGKKYHMLATENPSNFIFEERTSEYGVGMEAYQERVYSYLTADEVNEMKRFDPPNQHGELSEKRETLVAGYEDDEEPAAVAKKLSALLKVARLTAALDFKKPVKVAFQGECKIDGFWVPEFSVNDHLISLSELLSLIKEQRDAVYHFTQDSLRVFLDEITE